MNVGQKERNIGLDITRSFAILLVLFGHTSWIGNHYPKYVEIAMQAAPAFGVEMFFIISGFLIGNIILREIQSKNYSFSTFKYFLLRRSFKILPNYYFVLILNVILWYILYNNLPDNLLAYFFLQQNFSSPSLDFYRISWCLSIEYFSYILGPFLLFIGIKAFPIIQRKYVYLLVTLVVISAFNFSRIYFYFNYTLSDLIDWDDNIRKVVIYRLDAIYYGFLLRYIYNEFKGKILKIKNSLFFIGLILILWLYLFRAHFGISVEKTPGFMILLFLPLSSFFLCCLIPFLDNLKLKSKQISTFFINLSLMSYSIYLLHYTIILHTMKAIFPSDSLIEIELFLYTLLYWGITFLISYIFYKIYEKPLMDFRDKPYFKKRYAKA
ncbi:MAG: acyltransferase [Flavobacteriales bacterium]|nr:acyltransferase [Flavobacteriales bacterium]